MDAHVPGFLIREATMRDHRQLLSLARELDSINLPTDSGELRDLIARSTRSFRGRARERSRAAYLFCAETVDKAQVVAASLIIGKHGTPEAPHYYLEMDSDERYSRILRKMFRHTYLRLRYSMDGPTEVGGLIVTRAMRGHPERIGKQISWVRFLYIARHLARFEPCVLAEMLPPMAADYGNAFWDHYGRRVTGLSFREADRLSTHDKEFIRALFPETPLYTFLLPEEVREALGAVGENSRGAVRLLEQAGMKFLGHIDPFDGGPYYGAVTKELTPVRQRTTCVAVIDEVPAEERRAWLVGHENAAGFRAVRADTSVVNGTVALSAATLAALGIKQRARVDLVPLP
ncbi:MAG: arginine N-succinyltransferase [Candidatus Binataceae bacterium]